MKGKGREREEKGKGREREEKGKGKGRQANKGQRFRALRPSLSQTRLEVTIHTGEVLVGN